MLASPPNNRAMNILYSLQHLGFVIPPQAHGNQRSEWDAGARFDYENPEHRR